MRAQRLVRAAVLQKEAALSRGVTSVVAEPDAVAHKEHRIGLFNSESGECPRQAVLSISKRQMMKR